MAEGFFDRNVRRLLGRAQRSAEVKPYFRERLRLRLQAEASQLRAGAVPDPASPATLARRPGWGAAAAAILVVAVGAYGIWRYGLKTGDEAPPGGWRFGLKVNAPEVVSVETNRRVMIEIPKGAEGAVSLEKAGAEVARLALTDGARVELRPGDVPVLALGEGLLRVEARRALRVRAATVEVLLRPGADVEVEHVKRSGDGSMNKSWLVPGGLVVATGATVVAILVHQGNAEVKTPESRPAAIVAEKPVVIEVPSSKPSADDDIAKKLAQAEWKIADLEKKLAASKKESDKLAADLVKKKGVTIDQITARLAELRKGAGMAAFLPGKTSELIADLRGLGPEGTKALLDLLKSEDAKDRVIAAKLLEDLKDPASIPDLLEAALKDKDEMAAKMAGHAIALMEDPSAIEPLRQILAEKRSWESEVNALWGLTNLGDAAGLEQSIAYMNDSKVSNQARGALGANIALFMHTPEVMPIVDKTVHDFYKKDQIMEIAIGYYDAVDTAVARDRLQAIANDTRLSQAIRDQANQALNH